MSAEKMVKKTVEVKADMMDVTMVAK